MTSGNIRAHVKQPTAAWAATEADPAEPGLSHPPSPGRALLGCDGADKACPEIEKHLCQLQPEKGTSSTDYLKGWFNQKQTHTQHSHLSPVVECITM